MRTLNPKFSQHFAFIDARRNDVYDHIRSYLLKNKRNVSSYYSGGDADFIAAFSGSLDGFEKFREGALLILEKGPVKKDAVNSLFTGFNVDTPIILGGVDVKDDKYVNDEEFCKDYSNRVRLEETYMDYLSEQTLKRFGGENGVRKFLANMEKLGIITGYRTLHNFAVFKCRFFVTLSYCEPRTIDTILGDKYVLKKITELYHVESHSQNVDEFDRKTSFLMVGEFSNLGDFHRWKEHLYDALRKETQRINVFSFPVEGILFESPPYITNFPKFCELCTAYGALPKQSIMLGHPIFKEEEEIPESVVRLSLNALDGNGLVLGAPGCGKTWTMWLLAKQLFDKGKNVYIIDSTGGVQSKLDELVAKRVFREEDKRTIETLEFSEKHKNETLILPTGKIFIYKTDEEALPSLCEYLKSVISNYGEDLKGKRGTNNVVFFEEAHELFNKDKSRYVSSFSSLLQISARKGFSIWPSLQKLSQVSRTTSLNRDDIMSLCNDLKNRIVHRVDDPKETDAVYEWLLKPSREDEQFYDIRSALSSLPQGVAFVRFRTNGNNGYLSTVKVKVAEKYPEEEQ